MINWVAIVNTSNHLKASICIIIIIWANVAIMTQYMYTSQQLPVRSTFISLRVLTVVQVSNVATSIGDQSSKKNTHPCCTRKIQFSITSNRNFIRSRQNKCNFHPSSNIYFFHQNIKPRLIIPTSNESSQPLSSNYFNISANACTKT